MTGAHPARGDTHDGVDQLAATAVARLQTVAVRAMGVLRIVILVAATAGVIAFALGWYAADDPWPTYAVIGGVLAAAPAAIAAMARRRVSAVIDGAPHLVADLRAIAVDPTIRQRLAAVVARSSGRGWRRALDLWRLRRDVLGPHARAVGLWASVLALARLPWILLVTALGIGVLALWSLVALVMLAWP